MYTQIYPYATVFIWLFLQFVRIKMIFYYFAGHNNARVFTEKIWWKKNTVISLCFISIYLHLHKNLSKYARFKNGISLPEQTGNALCAALCAGGHVCRSCVHPAGSAVEHLPRCGLTPRNHRNLHRRRSHILAWTITITITVLAPKLKHDKLI